jgi:hypothetical protein
LLATLTLFAFVAALGLAVRTRPSSRAELGLTTLVLWNALVILPIYVLGLTNHLTRASLGWSAPVLFAVALAASFHKRRAREHLRDVGRAAWGLYSLPFDGIAHARRERHIVLLPLGLVFAALVWSYIQSWYAPSWYGWDALWYHEPIVGYTIQNHGFRILQLPDGGLEKINGYPRVGEMTELWFAIFCGRRLIDLAPSVTAPLLILAQYLLAMRFTRDKSRAMAWAASASLIPAGLVLLQSTYVDLHVAGLELAAAHFALRAEMRARDALVLAVALALAVGAKQMALVPVAMFGVIGLVRLLRQNWRAQRRGALLAAGGGFALVFAMGSTVYLRNYLHFHNPLWPELKVDVDWLGIHWPGNYLWGSGQEELGYNRIDMNEPFGQFIADLFSRPYSWSRSHYTEVLDYGFPVAWLVLPLGAVALVVLWVLATYTFARRLFAALLKRPAPDLAPETWAAVLLALTSFAMFYMTPALWAARYNVAPAAMLMLILAWAGSRAKWERFGEALASTVALASFIGFFWIAPRAWLLPSELLELKKIPYPERELTPAAKISPALDPRRGSPTNLDVGMKREKLAPGSIVVHDQSYGTFVSLMWNNDYSNNVVYVPYSPSFVKQAEEMGAMWIYAQYGDPLYKELSQKDSNWTDLGALNVEHWGAVFRRTKW